MIKHPDEFSSRVTPVYGNDPQPHTLRSNPPVRPAPDGNWDDEFEFRSKQVKNVKFTALNSRDTYRLAFGILIQNKASNDNPLPLTSLSDKQCDKINKAL